MAATVRPRAATPTARRERRSSATAVLRRLAAVVAAAACVTPAAATGTPPAPSLVFVLAGQSNMIGRARPVSAGAPSDPRLLVWRGKWRAAVDPIPSSDGMSRGDAGVGPTMTFGLGVLAGRPTATVGIVMCAVGGTSIDQWAPQAKLYRRCVDAAADAARSVGGRVAGILFLQGENEAVSCRPWRAGFELTESAFERDLGPVPFLLGQVGSLAPRSQPQCLAQVQADHAAAAAAHAEITLVPTADLPVGLDGLHFTVQAELILGRRFADAWLETQH
jgi:hypothetical protein